MIAPLLLAATLFRVVPLACVRDRLALAGGAVLRLADPALCATIRPGHAAVIALGDDGRVVTLRPPAAGRRAEPDVHPASEIPAAAYVLAPAGPGAAAAPGVVTVTIEVTVPPRTPAGDDCYVSTDRSGWNPAEIRMDRVDALHFRLALELRAGARLTFRITRGSVGTTERDASRALPPAHVIDAAPGARSLVTVAAWADQS